MQSIEQKIIRGCIRNEYKAQKMLYNKYYNLLMGVCLRYSHTKDEAEDVLIIGFYRIYKNMEKYNGKGSFENWMKRIVVNAAIDNYRKNNKHYHDEKVEDMESLADESGPLPEDLPIEEVRKAVNHLPSGYRMVFNLYSFEGYSHHDIAQMLDISVSTSKSQLRKARMALREQLQVLYHQFKERNLR